MKAAEADGAHGAVIAALGLVAKIGGLMREQIDQPSEFQGTKTAKEIEAMLIAEFGTESVLKVAEDLREHALKAAANRATRLRTNRRRAKRTKKSTDNEIGGRDCTGRAPQPGTMWPIWHAARRRPGSPACCSPKASRCRG